MGIPKRCILKQVFTTGGGSERVKTENIPSDGYAQSAAFDIPPMSASFYKMTYVRK
jgi:hypothetical protein